jgi:hypothetical protein
MASPVFGAADRVNSPPNNDGLPAELVGKSPAEIARYYTDREASLRAELDARPPARVTPPPEPPAPTNTEFWNDPNAAVDRKLAKAMTKDEFDRVAASMRPNFIWLAKKQCMENHPDFRRVEKEINEMMARVPDYSQTDPSMWETVYFQAKGIAHDRLAAEDRANPPVIVGEPVGPGGTAPPMSADLYKVTAPGVVDKAGNPKSAGRVADMLGVTHDQYRNADKILQGDGVLPLTVDNRRPK